MWLQKNRRIIWAGWRLVFAYRMRTAYSIYSAASNPYTGWRLTPARATVSERLISHNRTPITFWIIS